MAKVIAQQLLEADKRPEDLRAAVATTVSLLQAGIQLLDKWLRDRRLVRQEVANVAI